MRAIVLGLGLAGLMLAGCEDFERGLEAGRKMAEEEAAREARTPTEAAGEPQAVAPSDEEALQWAASVTEVTVLDGQSGKVFSTAGGDPAINGLYTYIAFFDGPDAGWRSFMIGDFESWTVAEQAPGRIVLDVSVGRIDGDSGEAVSTSERRIVEWTGELPTEVTVTPAR